MTIGLMKKFCARPICSTSVYEVKCGRLITPTAIRKAIAWYTASRAVYVALLNQNVMAIEPDANACR
jgi:hypothetical protein